ncbi:MAG: HAD-IC family P-type ATPase [Actinomycetota bacterium]|nr:HAD-IC family P-type ATPase [Actinomycetota bacterium]MDA3012622.1 HAD-IC family P-type ATPase [Actinomycetota bacterium]
MTISVENRSIALPHTASVDDVVASLSTDVMTGLSSGEVAERLTTYGPNRLAESKRRPAFLRFLDQFRDLLIMILLVAAVVSFAVSGELKTPVVVLLVVFLNALIGFVQENRAEASLEALKKMLTASSRVRRDGDVMEVATDDLVPGDIVLVEAGDRIPADGRLVLAANLEIEEAALTGESHPSEKSTLLVDRADAPLGDRSCIAYMNTTVTRGRGEFVVTSTGMNTEIGRIAGLLRETETEKTPLQKQLEGLAHSLAKLSGLIVAAVFAIGLLRGNSVSELLNLAVALAVATIPEGLPAVTAVTLAVGVSKMAKKNAIVKRLASVETLGCTSIICSDKTGTLTLNEMTARRLVVQNRDHAVTGEGYSPEGSIEKIPGDVPFTMDNALMGMALCNDAVIRHENGDWQLVGDPTEGALAVLATKGGLDVADLRVRYPRVAEVPFDSSTKVMATFHEVIGSSGERVVRMFVKGAPDVVLERATHAIGSDGESVPSSQLRTELLAHNDRMANEGLRVLAVAQRDIVLDAWNEFTDTGADPSILMSDLVLMALIGIVDPPRPEAQVAIAEARTAGITVKMITGDHAVTARAIGRELGLGDGQGDVVAVTGNDLDQMTDDELASRIDEISVFARVAPEHKIRLVAALQRKGRIVAMTGDGVNDAPALKKADMGVAMGITGTEVTKEAATMVLTDDNFATIVGAVKRGRTIYDNIVKFVRFQLSTTLGFAMLFLAASIFDIAHGKPFAAIAILWVNIIMDGPPAMALGLDKGDSDIMRRAPRPVSEKILTPQRWGAIVYSSVIMALGTLGVLIWAPGPEAEAGVATVAGTMAFNTFVLFQFFNILNARSDRNSVFRRHTLTNPQLWIALVAVIVLQVGVTHVGFMQRLFDTTSISITQWLVSIAVASSVLWFEELRKAFVRRTSRNS